MKQIRDKEIQEKSNVYLKLKNKKKLEEKGIKRVKICEKIVKNFHFTL